MAQRYTQPLALALMARDRCPECGEYPAAHAVPIQWRLYRPYNGCLLLPDGVRARIAQYHADHPDGDAA